MFEAHALGNLVGGLLVYEVCQDGVGIGEGSSGSLAGGDIGIDGHEVAGIGGLASASSKPG